MGTEISRILGVFRALFEFLRESFCPFAGLQDELGHELFSEKQI